MLFIPENELEKALIKAVKKPHAAPRFLSPAAGQRVCWSWALSQGQENATQAIHLAPGGNLRLVTGTKEGGQYLPVFSSLVRMQDYVKQESKYLSINGRALLDLTRGAPMILNPASEYGKEFAPDEVRRLLDGMGADIRTLDGDVDYPMALVGLLAKLFATRPEIDTAWMIQVAQADQRRKAPPADRHRSREPERHTAILAATDAGDRSRGTGFPARPGVRCATRRPLQSQRHDGGVAADRTFLSACRRSHLELISTRLSLKEPPCPRS